MSGPPVRPFPGLVPWSQPQSLDQLPRDYTPALGPIVGRVPMGPGGQALAPGELGADVQSVYDAHRYARLSGSARLPVGTASGLILAAPPTRRNFLVIRNASATANVFIDFGIAADATRTPIRLIPNAILIFDDVVPQDDVFAIADAANGVVGLSFSNVNYQVPESLTGI